MAAQKQTKDIDEWSNNSSFGQGGANLTDDGYSLWDGQSYQNYTLNSAGEIEIRNAAQLARYAWDMCEAEAAVRQDRKGRNVHLLCDIDLNGRRLNVQSSMFNAQLPKGIYIQNGKKYINR